jgi:hypothetical protein
MSSHSEEIPERIAPYILLTRPDEPVPLLEGPFRLIGSSEVLINADLRFRWSPSVAVEFEGECAASFSSFLEKDWLLASVGEPAFSVPAHLTYRQFGGETSKVRGVTACAFDVGAGPFEALRFCLTNLPDYLGSTVHCKSEDGESLMSGRLEINSESGCCQIDKIPEAKELLSVAEREAGFVISHVGLWVPSAGVMSIREADSILEMLYFWFGLLRGSWAGPLFPQGIDKDQAVVWRRFASWRLRGSRKVATWLPDRKPINLSTAFLGFVQRWHDAVWRDPLTTSIAWFVEANSPETAMESRIVLSQVALELLSWVLLVESQRLYHHRDFEVMSAAGRIRALLHHAGVPTAVPGHLGSLQSLCDDDAFDGPGVITKVRNALVHPTKKKRVLMDLVDGEQRMECSELALQYLELALLAVCGHDGYYARRGWRGWKGDDEVPVPWSQDC